YQADTIEVQTGPVGEEHGKEGSGTHEKTPTNWGEMTRASAPDVLPSQCGFRSTQLAKNHYYPGVYTAAGCRGCPWRAAAAECCVGPRCLHSHSWSQI